MNNDNEEKIIEERYKTLPTEVKQLIDLKLPESVVEEVAHNHNLNEEQQIALENRLYLILFFFLPSSNITTQIEELLEVDRFRASLIAEYIEAEIFDLIDDLLEATNQKFLLNESAPETNSTTISAISPENLEKVSPFRTMEGDAKKIHGYGAFRGAEPAKDDQPVYRSEQAKLVPPPSYTEDSSTRKDS